MSGFKKNVASQRWRIFAWDRTTGVAKTGDSANITAKIRLDYGAAAPTNDVNPTETESGFYEFDLTQAETNADVLDLIPVSATANISVVGVPGRVFTVPQYFSIMDLDSSGRTNISKWLGTAVTVSGTTSLPEVDAKSISDSSATADSVETNIGNLDDSVADIQTDVTAILADTADIQPKIGTPSVSVSADIASIQADTDAIEVDTQDIQTTLGSPAGASVSADIASIQADTDAIELDTQDIQTTLGTPVGADLSGDIAGVQTTADAVEVDTQDIQSKIGTPAVDVSADIASVQTDTDDIQTRLPASLVGGLMDSNIGAIDGNVESASDLSASARTIVTGSAVTGTLTTTQMTTDVVELTNDHFIGRIIIWTSGPLKDQATDITDYTGVGGLFTYSIVTDAPANGNTFVIV